MTMERDPEMLIAAWLDDGPAALPHDTRQAIVVGMRSVPRRRAGMPWPFGGAHLEGRHTGSRRLAFAVSSVALLAVAAIVLSNLRPNVPSGQAAALPTSPTDWSRVVIEAEVEGRVDSLVAGPRGLLATVDRGEDGSRLYFSPDGTSWTLVPLGESGGALVAHDDGFLIVGEEVSTSADGLSWNRLTSQSDDPELAQGTVAAVAAAGPGYVAVGNDNKAWYSTDGADWTLADVPARPAEPAVLERPLEMHGVVRSGDKLLAWGKSIWGHDDGSATFVPTFWTSNDGVSWTNGNSPSTRWTYPMVTSGPDGLLVADEAGTVWRSADGASWEPLARNVFGSSRHPNDGGAPPGNQMSVGAIAGGPAGFVAAGRDGACLFSCPTEEAVIWTSADGRTWTRLPFGELFGGIPAGQPAGAGAAAAWGPRFVVGGGYGGHPAVWISDSEQ